DTRLKPSISDKPHVGRMLYFTFENYIEQWEFIQSIFSKEAVLRGDFDRYIQDKRGKKPRAEIDRDFLNDLDSLRILLARNMALRNPDLSGRELNYAVQLTIDRLIFLRMCEDRGIEIQHTLQSLLNGERVYSRLVEIYYRADERYNSGLFHFSAKDGINPDIITPTLSIDDKLLKDIIKKLYYPDCPYEFSVLPVEVLGNAYEQFLGKRISLTAGHHARIEEKPEVRKAGGVYYTPQYIVDYIVKNTVGKLLEGKTPREVSDLRILDPACGSGSFLLGAYRFLVDWHLDYYQKDYEKTGKIPVSPQVRDKRTRKSDPQAIFEGKGGEWYLSTTEKKRILLNNLYGVDIDANAVEVTKLSLLLKVLENENSETLNRQIGLWHERALPNLSDNIKCGNSLIGPDFYENQQTALFDEEEALRVNVFDWQTEFKEIFVNGGFDAVIGNPPYIRIQTMKEWAPKEVEFYKKKYKAAKSGNYDIYVVFVEKALDLLNSKGYVGFILPHKFFNSKYGESLRNMIASGKHLAKVVHFGAQQIFTGATTYTCLMFLDKSGAESCEFVKVEDLNAWRMEGKATEGEIPNDKITNKEWNFIIGEGTELIDRLSRMPVKLKDVAKRIFQGLKTGADLVFIVEESGDGKYYSKALGKDISLENSLLHPLYKSGEMKRYNLYKNSRYVIFPYRNGDLIEWSKIVGESPKTAGYLEQCKDLLEKRENGRWKGKNWYCYSRNQALEIISSPKLLTADLNPFANYCYDKTGVVYFPGGAAGGYGIILDKVLYQYVLGLLNSKVVDYYHKNISTNYRGGWFGYDAKIIRNIPIRTIDFSNPKDKAQHDRMVLLVDQILDLNKKLLATRDPRSREQLQRRIDATDAQIDRLVY
ncbi:MAG: Eco57I restriction-modification methylase domain-containing protein, partial [Candidatus Marinimicrobia bacterium]|nr:Eco57I restriction-modification methylase domain-containing protein [Candidatus Neomarinimicrobiota bacterium]